MFSSPAVPDLEAWVENATSGGRLNEYQISHEAKTHAGYPTTTCFLETIDEPFIIKIKKPCHLVPEAEWRADLTIDGRKLNGSRWSKGHTKSFDHVRERVDGSFYKSQLSFTPLTTTDDDAKVTIDAKTLREVGSIEIRLQYGYWHKLVQRTALRSRSFPGVGIVHEKSKKMGYTVHATNRRPARESPPGRGAQFVPIPGGLQFYRFKFQYRSKPALEALRIIGKRHHESRICNPMRLNIRHKSHVPEDRDIGIVQARRGGRLRFDDEVHDVKPDSDDDDVQPQACSPPSQKKRKVEVIDLTLDDD
ncbi:hypothetical protein IAR55_002430 [Kwoniella newhampshirensis]|uniref:DUF7918 domain-containing protein n=1 Tax=Kwoniella newhampshirensis TaxID=1651941 RepID=A0AAW0YRG6_9TREE